MSRLNLSNQTVEQIIKKAQRDLETLKVKQYAGASNLVLIENYSASTYDASAAIISFGSATFYCEFKATFEKITLADMTLKLFIDGTAPANEILPGSASYPVFSPAVFNAIQDIYSEDLSLINRSIWRFTISNFSGSTHTYYVKYYVQASGAGTVSGVPLP